MISEKFCDKIFFPNNIFYDWYITFILNLCIMTCVKMEASTKWTWLAGLTIRFVGTLMIIANTDRRHCSWISLLKLFANREKWILTLIYLVGGNYSYWLKLYRTHWKAKPNFAALSTLFAKYQLKLLKRFCKHPSEQLSNVTLTKKIF